MKKILALLLAVTMLMSLVPAVFAYGTNDGVLEYNFNYMALGLEDKTDHPSMQKATETNNSLFYPSFDTTKSDKWGFVGFRETYYGNITDGFAHISFPAGSIGVANVGVVYAIHVPKGGRYTPSLSFAAADNGLAADVYLMKTSEYTLSSYPVGNSTTGAIIGAAVSRAATTKIATVYTYGDTASTYSDITLTEGDYYLAFKYTDVLGTGIVSGSKTLHYIRLSQLKLTKVEPASIRISADKTSVSVGGSVTVSAKALSSDGSELPDAVTFSSSDNAIATVDSATGVVTAVAPGKAMITAKCGKLSESISVAVTKEYTYYFGFDAIEGGVKGGFGADTFSVAGGDWGYEHIKASVSEPWEYLNLRTVNSSNMLANGFYYAVNDNHSGSTTSNHLIANSGLSFKIQVPEDGIYTPVTMYSPYVKGSRVNTYIITPEQALEKGFNLAVRANIGYANTTFTPVSSVSTIDSTVKNEKFGKVLPAEGTSVSLAKGECYVIFAVDGANADEALTGGSLAANGITSHFMLIQSLKLVKTDDYTPPSPENGEGIKKKLSFAVLTNYEEAKSGVAADITVGSAASLVAGTKVRVQASDVEGYAFSYWKTGSKFISAEREIEYTVVSNGALVAVYDKEEVGSENTGVEFYNENGAFLEKKEVAKGTTFASASAGVTPTLTGYTFDEWSIGADTVINKLTRAVAKYIRSNVTDENDAGEGNTISGNVVVKTSEETLTYKAPNYNSEITATTDGKFFSHWTRDGKIVNYDRTYTFRVWGSTEITAVYAPIAATKVPTVVLDATANNDAYMIEYDVPAGYTKIEAGIIFGESAPTITGFYTKAASKSTAAHGQFTAERNPNEDADMQAVVLGYLIYKDASGNIKVAYSD